MVDPIITGIVEAITSQTTGKAIRRAKKALSKSNDERETWNEIAKECAIQAKSAYYQHIHDVSLPDRSRSREIAGSVGEFAQELAIRGEIRGYDEDDIQLVRDLAQNCQKYNSSPMMHMGRFENEYKEAIDELSKQIFEMASD